ncbi:MAG: leucine-rich repeat protein [Paludibacteraceae bacterium]|nr:leucine-rich repeat protein [Paludibacteraceae bacterium]
MKKRFFLVLLMSCFALFTSASNYLTFTAEEDNSSFRIKNEGGNNPNVEYSLDDGETWTLLKAVIYNFEDDKDVVLANKGDKALLRGYNLDGFSKDDSKYTYFNMKGKIAASGSVMSLIDGIGESKTIPCEYCFYNLFCCQNLIQAPELPATVLSESCYEHMFGCNDLIIAPKLPATKLAKRCYKGMFESCRSLTQAPELPATKLEERCYEEMFRDCRKLTIVPDLPAIELAESCCLGMFESCTSLTQAPALPATNLDNACYLGMFESCTSLTQAPTLPATNLAIGCYQVMFLGCTSLTMTPEELPAKNLATYCYAGMFQNCTSLTMAPALPATEPVEKCYDLMFSGCKSLQNIKIGLTKWEGEETYSTTNYFWVSDVAPTGTFYCPKELPLEYGENRIPEGWTVEYIDESTAVAEYVSDASFKAWGADGKITYIGATMPVRIYDLGGKLVKEVKGETQSVSVPQHGTYVVKSGTVSVKVEL